MSIALISHLDCLLHEMGQGHPEQPARLQVIEDTLLHSALKEFLKKYTAPLAIREQLLRVHDAYYIDEIFRRAPQQGLVQLDPDTLMNPFTLPAALRAAGAVVNGVDLVLANEVKQAFCNVRPPGHHAEKSQAMGFCFFNNVAVGVAHALEQYSLERVAIIDFDVHHGNGTEDIFKNDKRVLFCSSFQSPFYPFSGAEISNNHILNLPLPAGTKGSLLREKIKEEWLPQLEEFEPQLLFFSAGFDGYIEDELADFYLVEDDYAWITQQVLKRTQCSAQGRVISVLEGGYHLAGLGPCVVAHVRALL